MAEPDVSVNEFNGLTTASPKDEGDFTDLIRADNLRFNEFGQIELRGGFALLGTKPNPLGAPADLNCFFKGKRVSDWVGSEVTIAYDSQLYIWRRPDQKEWTIIPGGTGIGYDNANGSSYGNFIYYPGGKKFDGTTVTSTAGWPSANGFTRVHNDRMWMTDSNDRLYFSAVGNPSSWPAANFIDVSGGPASNPIMGMRSFNNRLYIFKSDNLWVLETPGATTSWSLRKVSEDGCFADTISEWDGALYWFGVQGAYKFDGTTITTVSSPIKNLWDGFLPLVNLPQQPGYSSYSTIYEGHWIIVIGVWVGQGYKNQRILCYNIDQEKWTEWTFNWTRTMAPFTYYPFITGLWSEQVNSTGRARGIYMLVNDDPYFAIVGMTPDYQPKIVDELGSNKVGSLILRTFQYLGVLQTKYSDFGNPYDKKRVNQWMVEWHGGNMNINQYDEEGRTHPTISELGSDDPDVYMQRRIAGIGYFRRLSMKFTITPTIPRWRLGGLYGRMRGRGQQIKNVNQDMS